MRIRIPPLAALLVALPALLCSCAPEPRELHAHDGHGLSFPAMDAWAAEHPEGVIVLFDYHHDIAADTRAVAAPGSAKAWPPERPAGYEWLGALLCRHRGLSVAWVSGRALEKPNRESRLAWLERSLSRLPPSDAGSIRARLRLVDMAGLRARDWPRGLAVTLDLDVLKESGDAGREAFLGEILDWIAEARPGLATVALSSAYQPDAAAGFGALEATLRSGAFRGASLFLEAETVRAPEGAEEARARRLWDASPAAFRGPESGFWADPGLWLRAPASLRAAFLKAGARAGTETAAAVLAAWADPDLVRLEAGTPEPERRALVDAARSTIAARLRGEAGQPPAVGAAATERGLALRLLADGLDRGCLALYSGVDDLESAAVFCASEALADPRYPPVAPGEAGELVIELSLFGPWRPMGGPTDFLPGFHSLLLSAGGQSTLLQASLATQRPWSRERFLEALCAKAGLPRDAWKTDLGLVWRKSATIWRSEPFVVEGQ